MAVDRLGQVCRERGPEQTAQRLQQLSTWLAGDMLGFDGELEGLLSGKSVVQRSAQHLLDVRGKHLRPICVAISAKLGSGFDRSARDLAVAVELLHSATLLHDDVIDLGERRRGAPAARTIYGNAASVLAGDRLLVESLRRIQRSGFDQLIAPALDTLEQMIEAEAIQLENRGRINASIDDYFRVVEGKTASVFRWAMQAGATAGGLSDAERSALMNYGVHLGVAFQLVDDVLDVDGDPQVTGKATFADLREGKMTYPLLLALQRDPSVRPLLQWFIRQPSDDAPPSMTLHARVREKLVATNSIEDGRALARQRSDEAIACLDVLPEGRGRTALTTVAALVVDRAA